MSGATRPSAPSAVRELFDVVASEAIKLRSVRSTYGLLLAVVAANVGLAGALAIFLPGRLSGHEKATLDPTRVSLGGIHISQVAIGLLGVLVITSEYSSGMIRATLSAVPRRRLLLTAKTLVFTATALAVGILASFAAFIVFQTALSGDVLATSIDDPGVLRALAGGGLYLTAIGLLGFGLGATIRSGAGAVAALFGVIFIPPLLVGLLPQSLQDTLNPYVPLEAGSQIFAVRQDTGSLGAWPSFGVLCIYPALALAASFILITRRDA